MGLSRPPLHLLGKSCKLRRTALSKPHNYFMFSLVVIACIMVRKARWASHSTCMRSQVLRIILQKESDEESDEEEDDMTTPGKKRKHIRKIIKDKKISKEAKDAAKAEEERRKRVKEKQKLVRLLELSHSCQSLASAFGDKKVQVFWCS